MYLRLAPLPIFIKFSPLIDPVKYMLGKYESLNVNGDILDIPVLSKLEKRGLLKANDLTFLMMKVAVPVYVNAGFVGYTLKPQELVKVCKLMNF